MYSVIVVVIRNQVSEEILLTQVSTCLISETTVQFTVEQAMKTQSVSRDITVLFL